MSGDLTGMYTHHMFPPDGSNKLTEDLIAQGCDPADSKTWPEYAYSIDGEHFVYKWDWRFALIWESPCGLMHRGHGQSWGELHVNGVYHCKENGNPLFRCPYPGRACPHRLQGVPLGINCQFHRTDHEYDPEHEIDEIERQKRNAQWRAFEADHEAHPGYWTPCRCTDHATGKIAWRLYDCIGCTNTECIARGWAVRDLTPVNVFYDLEIERVDNTGLIPDVHRTITKGMKVFQKPIARTDAELALAIWKHDPQSYLLPADMERKLRGYTYERAEGIGLIYRRRYNHEFITATVTIRNIYIAKQEQRDLMADLEAVREGAEVVHESDRVKAAAAEKTDRRKQNEIEQSARMLANGSRTALWAYAVQEDDSKRVRERKDEMRAAIIKRADEIKAKREADEARKRAKGEQLTMLDMLGG